MGYSRSWSNRSRRVRGAKVATSLAGLALATALVPAGASASSHATCGLMDGRARCAGTLANRTISPSPSAGSLQVRHGYARLTVSVRPLVSIFTPNLTVTSRLKVIQAGTYMRLAGPGLVDGEPVMIDGIATQAGKIASLNIRSR